MMRKKDYELIAEGLRVLPKSILPDVAEHFADILGAEYPKFDRQKFLTACGIDVDFRGYKKAKIPNFSSHL